MRPCHVVDALTRDYIHERIHEYINEFIHEYLADMFEPVDASRRYELRCR